MQNVRDVTDGASHNPHLLDADLHVQNPSRADADWSCDQN